MKQKVIKLNESDIERLVNKIIKEESINELDIESFKRENLKPAIAEIKGEKVLVIVDEKNTVHATGPKLRHMGGVSKERICQIADGLIEELFVLDETELNEIDSGSISNIKPINFCTK
jgi:hypothetical protein